MIGFASNNFSLILIQIQVLLVFRLTVEIINWYTKALSEFGLLRSAIDCPSKGYKLVEMLKHGF